MSGHDPLCPNVPCSCEPDDYGHEWTCSIQCSCAIITKVRADECERIRTGVNALGHIDEMCDYGRFGPDGDSVCSCSIGQVLDIIEGKAST